jgi:hypothetical protein
MKFEINFNTETNDMLLEAIGAVLTPTGATKYPPFEIYTIELNSFDELESLLEKVNRDGKYYSAIISYDPPTIYLDCNV